MDLKGNEYMKNVWVKIKNSRLRPTQLLSRLALALAILMAVGCILTGCSSKGATTPALKVNEDLISRRVAAEKDDGTRTEANMGYSDLALLAGDISKLDDAAAVREMIVAASLGNDMTGKADAKTPDAILKQILTEHEVAYDKDKVLLPSDVDILVDCFAEPITVEEEAGFLTKLLIWIALGFEWMINTLGFGSFILGTLWFAIAIEILMIPLAIVQQKNARKQAKLRPMEMAIRNKYKGRNDQATQQKVNQEIQEMYQKEGYNPLSSGCLPLLVSFPVLIALYYIVIDPLKYMMECASGLSAALNTYATAAPEAGGLGLTLKSTRGSIEILSYIREQGGIDCLEGLKTFKFFSNGEDCYRILSGILEKHEIPNFSIGTVNFGLTPSFGKPWWLLVIPVLTFVTYFGSMKLTKLWNPQQQAVSKDQPGAGCSNTMMDIMMPALSTWFTFLVPGAVGLYWCFKSVISTLKSFIMSRVMPLPKFTEEDYKAAEKELAGKAKDKPVKKSGTGNPNVRSLHHIDDEEYDGTAPAAKPAARKPYVEDDEETGPETAGKPGKSKGAGLVNAAPLKQDDRRAEQQANQDNEESGDSQTTDDGQDDRD